MTPLMGFRETAYNRSLLQSDRPTSREALYFSNSVDTRLVRRFAQEGGVGITHKIEPAVIYEYLTPTRQADLPVFNDVDRLTPKNLLTYELTNRLSTMVSAGDTMRYLEFGYLRLTQSQHPAYLPTVTHFSSPRRVLILSKSQPIPPSVDVVTMSHISEP